MLVVLERHFKLSSKTTLNYTFELLYAPITPPHSKFEKDLSDPHPQQLLSYANRFVMGWHQIN